MRRFANLFIILFLVDALLRVAGELTAPLSGALPSEQLGLPAWLLPVHAALLFACLGLDRRLPKRLLVPLTLYASWSAVALWPLSGLVGYAAVGPLAAGVQLLLGVLTLVWLHRRGGGWLLPAGWFAGPAFGWRNFLVFNAVNLLLAPLLLLFMTLALVGSALEEHTAGFLRLSPIGIYMSERRYQRVENEVRLAAMMHVGKQEYFEEMAGSLAGGRTVVLVEGVTDRTGRLAGGFGYGRLAELIGLTSQETMQLPGQPVELAEFDALPAGAAAPGHPLLVRADLDLASFDPRTVELLQVLGRTLLSGRPLAETLAEYNAWAQANVTPERVAVVMGDIIDKRNAVVIDALERAVKRYDTVIVPWGAMHMPAIEAALLEQGFVAGERKERLSLDFRELPYGELWHRLEGLTAGGE